MKNKPPKYVIMGNTALRLEGDYYYRDGGDWSVGYKYENDILLTWHPGKEHPQLHRNVLTKITEKEYLENNYPYGKTTKEVNKITKKQIPFNSMSHKQHIDIKSLKESVSNLRDYIEYIEEYGYVGTFELRPDEIIIKSENAIELISDANQLLFEITNSIRSSFEH